MSVVATQFGKTVVPDVVKIREDEGLLELESASNDVSGVLESERVDLFQLEIRLEQELLIIYEIKDSTTVSVDYDRGSIYL